MKKRILFIPSTMGGGVYYYRVFTPMKALIENYGDEFDITINNTYKFTDAEKDEIGKNFDIVCFHQCLFTSSFQDEVWKMIIYCKKEYGTKFVLDIDDWFDYGKTHPAYNACIFNMFPDKMMMNFKLFDYVTTTTEYFKSGISQWVSPERIYVFENSISSNDEQFSFNKNKSEKIRIGLTGGSSHTEDIKTLMGFWNYLTVREKDKIEFHFCGYDNKNAENVVIDENGKVVERQHLADKDNWWVQTENKIKYGVGESSYKRVETKDIMKGEFGLIYNDIDILLAPLKNTNFNHYKSELKFIEAGFTNTAIISSGVVPYSNFGKDNIDCLLVKDNTPKGWAKAIKKLVNNDDLRIGLAKNNMERILIDRNLEKITEKRYEFFKSI